MVSFRFDGSDVLARISRAVDALAAHELQDIAANGAGLIADEWRLLFQSSNASSVPGLPPRVQTGAYLRDIDVHPDAADNAFGSVVIGTSSLDVPYDRFLEFGTRKMPAHPIARPAYEITKQDAADQMTDEAHQRILEAIG